MKQEMRAPWLDPEADSILAAAMTPRRALFLDRDGVVNVDHGYVHTPETTDWMPGIFDLCRSFHQAGWLLIVVTNQAGIGRGYYSEEQFLKYTAWVHAEFSRQGAPLLATYYCPHHPEAGVGEYLRACKCRKPQPGMIEAAIKQWRLVPSEAALMGDKLSDIQSAAAAGIANAHLVSGCLPEFRDILL